MALLELHNISKVYKMGSVHVDALKDVNFSVQEGEFVVIVGPSGSGKSTLLDLIGCLNRPTSGNVIIEGNNTSTLSESGLAMIRRETIGFVFQTFNLIPRLNALENVTLPMWFAGIDTATREERSKELLKLVGLENRIYYKPTELSGGQRQRVAIARALVNDPKIILADEPTGNLDSKSGRDIVEILTNLNHDNGKTIILVTHNEKLADFADKKISMRDGTINKIEVLAS